MIVETSEISFPRISVCSSSMHSLEKLRIHYPNVTKMMLKELYIQSPLTEVIAFSKHHHGYNAVSVPKDDLIHSIDFCQYMYLT